MLQNATRAHNKEGCSGEGVYTVSRQRPLKLLGRRKFMNGNFFLHAPTFQSSLGSGINLQHEIFVSECCIYPHELLQCVGSPGWGI